MLVASIRHRNDSKQQQRGADLKFDSYDMISSQSPWQKLIGYALTQVTELKVDRESERLN